MPSKRTSSKPGIPSKYAELRKQLTKLGEARRQYQRSLGVAAEAAQRRNREAFYRVLAETRRMANAVLAQEGE